MSEIVSVPCQHTERAFTNLVGEKLYFEIILICAYFAYFNGENISLLAHYMCVYIYIHIVGISIEMKRIMQRNSPYYSLQLLSICDPSYFIHVFYLLPLQIFKLYFVL